MQATLTIGEFSRMTHLSVKTLRHYHEVGLLEPAQVDPGSGYRYYTTTQIPTAQVIRRLRDLEMPVEEVRAILVAPDLETRNALIARHLERMEDQLEQTRSAVASLRSLVGRTPAPIAIERRDVAPTAALAISETVSRAELGSWWSQAFAELRVALEKRRLTPAAAPGGLYASELFERELGDVVVFIPIDGPSSNGRTAPAAGRVHSIVVPPGELAIAVHHGSHVDVDRTYGALGSYVAEHAVGVDGPVREHYLVSRLDTADEASWKTEIGWPIFQTTAL
jgi:DNA-binding transcriptional MerR regulator